MSCRIELPKTTKPENDRDNLHKIQCELLKWAEDLFGKRDESWTILPPDFDECTPHIFYLKPFAQKLVQIRLVCRAHEEWPYALYQMAHEVIHLLNPKQKDFETGSRDTANVLEEGVACAFSFYVLRMCDIDVEQFKRKSLPSYKHAHKLVARLKSGDIAAAKRIRRELPSSTPFQRVTKDDLLCIFPNLDPKHADALTDKFERDKTDFQCSF